MSFNTTTGLSTSINNTGTGVSGFDLDSLIVNGVNLGDITDIGSGSIITVSERSAISSNTTAVNRDTLPQSQIPVYTVSGADFSIASANGTAYPGFQIATQLYRITINNNSGSAATYLIPIQGVGNSDVIDVSFLFNSPASRSRIAPVDTVVYHNATASSSPIDLRQKVSLSVPTGFNAFGFVRIQYLL